MKINKNGYTLIEAMTVVAIIGILTTIAVPNMLKLAADFKLKAAARDLSSLLRKARLKAIKEKRRVIISFNFDQEGCKTDGWYVFDAEGRGCKVIPDAGSIGLRYGGGVHFGFGKAKKGASSTGKLPSRPTSFQGRKIQFNAMGLCTAGYVYFSNNYGTAIAIGANSTGVLKYKQWNGSKWK